MSRCSSSEASTSFQSVPVSVAKSTLITGAVCSVGLTVACLPVEEAARRLGSLFSFLSKARAANVLRDGGAAATETVRTRSPRDDAAPAPICSSTVRACANDAMISDNSVCDAMLTERPPRVCTNSPSGVRTHAPSPATPGATASREFFLLDVFASVAANPRCAAATPVPLVERCCVCATARATIAATSASSSLLFDAWRFVDGAEMSREFEKLGFDEAGAGGSSSSSSSSSIKLRNSFRS